MRFALTLFLSVILSVSLSCKKSSKAEDTAKFNPMPKLRNQTLRPVRFLPQWHHQAQFAGIYVAKAKGYYENYGLDVIIQSGGPNMPASTSLINNKTDITSLFLLAALAQREQGHRLINLAQISQKSSLMLAAKKENGINSVQDLNHKKIGLWRSDFRELSIIFMKMNKLDMEIVPIDWTINLFLKGPIDAMNVMRYNEYHQILQAGINPDELFIVPFSDTGLDIVEDGIYCMEDFYLQDPRLCKDFAEATIEGWIYAINHQKEAVDIVLEIMSRDYLPANRPHQEWMLKTMSEVILARGGVVGTLEESSFNEAQDLMFNNGLITKRTPYREFFPYAPQNK